LTCLVQHEFYHQYAADEHTLICLEQIDRVWDAKSEPYSAYTQLLHELEHPYLLYLALLLHDVGKADGHGDHSNVSAKLANRVARRLRLDDSAAQMLESVIVHHLLMAVTSQRRDLEDPSVIRIFAKQVGNTESLTLLTILTFVDSMATSDKLWNGFKELLLWSLYRKGAQLLTGGTEFLRAEEKQREQLMKEVNEEIPAGLEAEEVEAHFAALPPRYFQIHGAADIAEDIELAHRFMEQQVFPGDNALAPTTRWKHHRDRGYSDVRICTWDRAGLFSKITGTLSAVGLNILSAQIFTRTDAIVLDVFSVTDGRTGSLAETQQTEKFDQLMKRVLMNEVVDLSALIAKQTRARTLYQAYTGEQIPTQITLDNEASETRSLIEIETEDRIGLLYTISQTFAELNLNISAAKISTEKGAAIDSFYVNTTDGGKIEPARWEAIVPILRTAIEKLQPR